jgi:small subunit ribosomal protein S25
MPRKSNAIPGPSRLSQILSNFTTNPRLELVNLRRLGLTLAVKNNHFGARYVILLYFVFILN